MCYEASVPESGQCSMWQACLRVGKQACLRVGGASVPESGPCLVRGNHA